MIGTSPIGFSILFQGSLELLTMRFNVDGHLLITDSLVDLAEPKVDASQRIEIRRVCRHHFIGPQCASQCFG